MSPHGPLSDQLLSQATRKQSLKKPLRWAAAIHIVILLVAIIGLPRLKKEPFDLTQAVQVDLIAPNADTSAAPNKTNSKAALKPNVKPKPKEVEPPKPTEQKPPSPVKSDAAKKDVLPKPDEPPKPKEAVEKPKKLTTKPAEDKKVKLEKPKKPVEKKAIDDNKGEAQKQEEFNSVLKNLLAQEDEAPAANPVQAPVDEKAKVIGSAPTTSETLALSEMDALKYQLARCWNIPTGAMNAEDLIVDVRITVRPDRTVETAEIVDQSRYNSDEFFRAAADSARRAVFNPICTPLALPEDKYETWKEILIRFNPKEMFGG